jgi:hypothetical protein
MPYLLKVTKCWPPPELILWLGALTYLAIINPYKEANGQCFFTWLGLSWCPGCGIGHAISFALHGNITASFKSHYFGVVALIILLHRIFVLSKSYYQTLTIKNPTHGQKPTHDAS